MNWLKRTGILLLCSILAFSVVGVMPAGNAAALSLKEIQYTEVTKIDFSINSKYYLVPYGTEMAATAIATSDPGSDKLVFSKFTGNEDQKWLILPATNKGSENEIHVDSDDCYYLVSVPRQLCINGESNGTVRGFMYLQFARQNYAVKRTSDGYFTFQNLDSAKYLGSSGTPSEGASILQMNTADNTQKWKVYAVDDELADKISVSQIGFAPDSPKVANFTSRNKISPPSYQILKNGKTVMSGKTAEPNYAMGVYSYKIDFSKITAEGTYTIKVDVDHVSSVECKISKNVYKKLTGINLDTGKGTTQSLTSILNGFYQFQRCTASQCAISPGEERTGSQHYGDDTNIPIRRQYNDISKNTQTINGKVEPTLGVDTGETWKDASGGYHDATSNDKPTGAQAKLLHSFCLMYTMADSDEKAGIRKEIAWAADYLCRIQRANGAFYMGVKPQDPGWPPRHLIELDGADVACRVSAALAEASAAMEGYDQARQKKYLAAAKAGFAYYESNPTNFINTSLWNITWTGNAGSILAAAVNLYAVTGEKKYQDVAERLIYEGMFSDGVWTSVTGGWNVGQLNNAMDEAMHGQAVDALCAYYPLAKGDSKDRVVKLVTQWLSYMSASCYSDYGIDPSTLTSYFGACGWYGQVAEKAAYVAAVFNSQKARDLAVNMVGFITGNNPIGASYAVGIGKNVGTALYSRPYTGSIGMVLPGIYTTSTAVTSRTDSTSISWKVGEGSIDTTSAFVSALVSLNRLANGGLKNTTTTTTTKPGTSSGTSSSSASSDASAVSDTVSEETSLPEESVVSDVTSEDSQTDPSDSFDVPANGKVSPWAIVIPIVVVVAALAAAALVICKKKKLLFFKDKP